MTDKCVLPFIINDSWVYSEAIRDRIDEERQKDGVELTENKEQRLSEWKRSIQEYYVIEEGFTTPSDLTSKVLAALIPELIDRNYADVVKNLILRRELSYRCDRHAIRLAFLFRNHNTKSFFKVFIVHGEKPEWPVFFSNNIAEYDLNAGENSKTLNMDNYNSNSPIKFLDNFILDAYQSIFRIFPEPAAVTLDALASKVQADDRLTNIVLIYDMEYASWKEKYKRSLLFFFNKLVEANATLKPGKNFYLLINIRYEKARERVKETPNGSILLERLLPVKKSHVEEWVRAYFFSNTRKEGDIKNYVHDMAQKISDHYFPEYTGGASFTMETAKARLIRIIDDFNNNASLFSHYTKPSGK